MTILIADDIETNRKLARASVKSTNSEIVEVTNGADALRVLSTATTPIVGLIDWEMPEMDGLEVCRQARLRINAPPLFLILLTVRDSQKDIVLGLQQGANDYVVKPFDYAELLARVKIGIQIVELQQKLMDQARELREALDRVKLLSGLLPICSYCHKIKNEGNDWERVDTYVAHHSEANFSHGICPDCYVEHLVPQLEKLASEPKA